MGPTEPLRITLQLTEEAYSDYAPWLTTLWLAWESSSRARTCQLRSFCSRQTCDDGRRPGRYTVTRRTSHLIRQIYELRLRAQNLAPSVSLQCANSNPCRSHKIQLRGNTPHPPRPLTRGLFFHLAFRKTDRLEIWASEHGR